MVSFLNRITANSLYFVIAQQDLILGLWALPLLQQLRRLLHWALGVDFLDQNQPLALH